MVKQLLYVPGHNETQLPVYWIVLTTAITLQCKCHLQFNVVFYLIRYSECSPLPSAKKISSFQFHYCASCPPVFLTAWFTLFSFLPTFPCYFFIDGHTAYCYGRFSRSVQAHILQYHMSVCLRRWGRDIVWTDLRTAHRLCMLWWGNAGCITPLRDQPSLRLWSIWSRFSPVFYQR